MDILTKEPVLSINNKSIPLVHYAFQPIIDINNNEIYGYEALMRPEGLSPQGFIQKYADNNKAYYIELITFYNALRCFKGFGKKYDIKGKYLFINSMPMITLYDSDLNFILSEFSDIIPFIVLELLEFESTTKHCMAHKQSLREKLNIQLAIDDYCTGYNSIDTVNDILPNIVKIDASFIHNIDINHTHQNLLKIMLRSIRDRKIKVIAEGVETKEEYIYIKNNTDIEMIQGFFFSKPITNY